MSSVGLDFLEARGWKSSVDNNGLLRSEILDKSLPSTILPLKRKEALIAGAASTEHRRGKGLLWPPESQVPVLGKRENGSGRVPLAAVFETLSKAETEWGKLGDSTISWIPEGTHKVGVQAAKLIAVQVSDAANDIPHVGLVVGDSLGVAGQEAIIKACFDKPTILLVPKTVAVSLAWCRAQKPRDFLSIIREKYLGHLMVFDLALGSWSIAKIPISMEIHNEEPYLTPVHIPKLKKNRMRTTGWSILFSELASIDMPGLDENLWDDLSAGRLNLSIVSPRRFSGVEDQLDSLQPLWGNCDLDDALLEIDSVIQALSVNSEHGKCLGVIISGPLSTVRVAGKKLADIISCRLGDVQFIANDAKSAAAGAAHAAHGLANNKPTWLEMVEPLEIHGIKKNKKGDYEAAWLELLKEVKIGAGLEYRSPNPIGGLALKAGQVHIQSILRRRNENGEWDYRKVDSTRGKTARENIPLLINVTARPGQGFAKIQIESKEADLFECYLNWQEMEKCDQPIAPKLAYIPNVVTLLESPELWKNCVSPLEDLVKILWKTRDEDLIVAAAKAANSKLNRVIPSYVYKLYYNPQIAENIYDNYTPLGRNASADASGRIKIINELEEVTLSLLKSNFFQVRTTQWLIKIMAWRYLGCPKEIVRNCLDTVCKRHSAPKPAELLVAGLCLNSSADFELFYRSFNRKVLQSTSPNNWLKALRDIVKYNDDALCAVQSEQMRLLFKNTLQRFEIALVNHKPLIAQNAIEALVFLLKGRRYNPDFVSPNTEEYDLAQRLAVRCSKHHFMTQKCIQFALDFEKFLRSAGDERSAGSFTITTTEDENAVA